MSRPAWAAIPIGGLKGHCSIIPATMSLFSIGLPAVLLSSIMAMDTGEYSTTGIAFTNTLFLELG